MILIIDSGSTKADWIFTDGKTKKLFTSPGMNPYFLKEDEIVRMIKKNITGINFKTIVKVFFYGAGCSGKELNGIVAGAFKRVFTTAKVTVDHDILGAVLATCGKEEGISCIIGTGCNSVYFDGKKIEKNNYGLGFILADEGSGSWLGKKLVTHYLYGLLPEKLSDQFKKKYRLTKDKIVTSVYNKPLANSWLASLAPFLVENKDNFWVKNTVLNGFDEFVKLYVMNYPKYQKVPVHFVGSIAYLFVDLLDEILVANNIQKGIVIKKPIDGLVNYISQKEFGSKY